VEFGGVFFITGWKRREGEKERGVRKKRKTRLGDVRGERTFDFNIKFMENSKKIH
jgi:hypothetical protein